VDVERGSNPEESRGIEAVDMARHPTFLLRSAQPNPNQVGLNRIDHLHGLFRLVDGEGPKWWRKSADHSETWKLTRETRSQRFWDPLLTTVEEV
jgi:hypothetical protein